MHRTFGVLAIAYDNHELRVPLPCGALGQIQVVPNMAAGGCVLFDSRLMHR